MAGAGIKLWATADTVTATEFQTYLQDQIVAVFDDTSARDAAFGGAGEPTVQEGMTAYIKDVNQIHAYASAWVPLLDLDTWAADASGNYTIKGTVTVGVDDTGHDVKFFGATATNGYMLWDESTDDLVLGTASRLGIGIAAPTSSLHVSNATNITPDGNSVGHIQISGSGYAGCFALDGDGFWMSQNSASRSLIFATDETQRMAIDGSGNVTVGVDGTGYDVKFFGDTATNGYMLWDQSTDDLILGSSSKLGLGATSPSYPLHISTTDNRPIGIVSSVAGSYLDMRDTDTTGEGYVSVGAVGNDLRLIAGGTLRATIASAGTTTFHAPVTVGADTDGNDVKFFGNTTGAYMLWDESTDDLVLAGAARLGIGRTAPAYSLDIETPNASTYARIRITHTYSSYSRAALYLEGGSNDGAIIYMGDNDDVDIGQIQYWNPDNSMRFVTNTAERMRIDSGGQVGIGDAAPAYLLDIDEAVSDAVPLHVEMSSGGTAYQYLARFSRNGGLMTNGVYCDTGTAYFGTPSDERVKRDIATIDPADSLAAITALRPVDFRFIADPDEGEIRNGLIAQEVELVIPAAVHTVIDSEPRRETVSVPRVETVVDDDGNETTVPVLGEDGNQIIDEDTQPVLDENGQKIIDVTGDTKMMEWNALTAHMIGAIKNIDARIATLEATA